MASLFTSTAAISMLENITSSSASAKSQSISGLTPCSESKAFTKRKNQELKELQKRTERRFNNYGKGGLLCGNDGLPHLIAEPALALKNGRANDMFIPTIGFLYIAGWIGHSGRLYLEEMRKELKNKEGNKVRRWLLISDVGLDVPLAIAIFAKAFAWPVMVGQLIASDTLLEKDENISVSPR